MSLDLEHALGHVREENLPQVSVVKPPHGLLAILVKNTESGKHVSAVSGALIVVGKVGGGQNGSPNFRSG